MHWMNTGEGAHLRFQDYLGQTSGAGTTPGPGEALAVGSKRLEAHARAEAAAAEVRGRFLAAMDTAGNPGSVQLTLLPERVTVACWELVQAVALGDRARSLRRWYFTATGEIRYLGDVRTKRAIFGGRKRALLVGRQYFSHLRVAELLEALAAKNGVTLG